MPTFAVLTNFTNQGIQDAKASPDRFEAGGALLEQMGVKIQAHYWLMGLTGLGSLCPWPLSGNNKLRALSGCARISTSGDRLRCGICLGKR